VRWAAALLLVLVPQSARAIEGHAGAQIAASAVGLGGVSVGAFGGVDLPPMFRVGALAQLAVIQPHYLDEACYSTTTPEANPDCVRGESLVAAYGELHPLLGRGVDPFVGAISGVAFRPVHRGATLHDFAVGPSLGVDFKASPLFIGLSGAFLFLPTYQGERKTALLHTSVRIGVRF
jgi:hypothetical protein